MRLGERPSMVVTALPCTADAGMRQENMRSPSMCTMQAPHWPAPQPNLVPVSFSSSRSTHRRRVPSGAATLTCLLLTVNSIAMMAPLCWAADGPEGLDSVTGVVRSHATPRAKSAPMLRCRWPTSSRPRVISPEAGTKKQVPGAPGACSARLKPGLRRLPEPRRWSGLIHEVELQGVYVLANDVLQAQLGVPVEEVTSADSPHEAVVVAEV